MPIKLYRLRKMPDGKEEFVTRKRYLFTHFHDFVLRKPALSMANVARFFFEVISGRDVACIFIGKNYVGNITSILTPREAIQMGIADIEIFENVLKEIERNKDRYKARIT